LIAAPNENLAPMTWIYKNGVPVAEVEGTAEGWIDNNHLLAATFEFLPYGGGYAFNGSAIYDATGALVKTILNYAIPQFIDPYAGYPIHRPQFPSADSVYDSQGNTIYSLTTALVTWQGSPTSSFFRAPVNGQVTGSIVIFERNQQVQVVPVN
jgi:hypothetical protein